MEFVDAIDARVGPYAMLTHTPHADEHQCQRMLRDGAVAITSDAVGGNPARRRRLYIHIAGDAGTKENDHL